MKTKKEIVKNIVIDVLLFILDWTWCLPWNVIGRVKSYFWKETMQPATNATIKWIKDFERKWRVKIYLVESADRTEHWFWRFISGSGIGRFISLCETSPDDSKVNDTCTIKHENGHVITCRILGPFFILVVIFSPAYNLIGRKKMKNGMTWLETAKWYYSRWCEKLADFFGKVDRKAWLDARDWR